MVYKGGSAQRKHSEVLQAMEVLYKDKYDFSNTVYSGSKKPLFFVCAIHGPVSRKAELMLQGRGCPECGKQQASQSRRLGRDRIIERFREVHGDRYNYEDINPSVQGDVVTLRCSVHGDFTISVVQHFAGAGCQKCGMAGCGVLGTLNDFIARARKVHGNKYNYDRTEYRGYKLNTLINCPEHGDFEQSPNNHLQGKGCSGCSYKNPNAEVQISDFLRGLGVAHDMNRRGLLSGRELDIYIPEHNLAIEHNGLYWHSDAHKPRLYHVQKRQMCEDKGIRLLQIFEDEWLSRPDAIKGIIKHALGLSTKVFARDTQVIECDTHRFMEQYHHAGAVKYARGFALLHDGQIVMAMSFRKWLENRTEFTGWEIARSASSVNVVGGFSKLLSHAEKVLKPKKWVSFCDLRFFDGHSYQSSGFEHIRCSEPTQWWVKALQRKHPRSFTKDKTRQLFGDYPTAREALEANGWRSLYDCGHDRYEKVLV
jgi:hypothetical protein